MRKKIATLAVALAVTFLPTSNALSITGELNLTGSVNLDSHDLAGATRVVSFVEAFANPASSGVFEDAGLFGESVIVYGFDFTNFDPVNTLWSLVSGGDTFEFSLTGLTVLEHSTQFLNILGTGMLTSDDPSYAATPGSFSFTISEPSGEPSSEGSGTTFKFGFQSATTGSHSVPDGGASIVLLGVGLLGLAALRRRP